MEIRKISLILLSIMILFSSKTHLIVSDDTITSTQSLTGNSTIISKQGNFELGFFTPGNSRNYYIGIWYKKVSVRTVVWVANRDKPLRDPLSSEFKFLENGNLVVFDQSKIPIWSTGSTSSTSSSYEALLGDDGNLVVRGVLNKAEVIWQSFDNPTDTWLPGAKLAFHGNSNKLQTLASWKNEEDPGYGIYSIGLDSGGTDQFVMKSNRNQTYWKTGTWDGQFFSSLPEIRINYVFKFKFVLINDQEWYFTYTIYNNSIYYRLVMDLSGKFLQYAWSNSTQQWSQPRYQCDVYGICGNCDQKCSCLAGSKDRSSNVGNSYDGCVRRTSLQCENRDGFYRIANMSTPSSNDTLVVGNADECKLACTKNCTCSAYAYGIHGCSLWYGDLSNMKESADSGVDIYLKLGGTNNTASTNQIEKDPKPNSKDLQRKKEHNSEVIIIPTVLVGALIMSFFLYFSWRWILKQRGNRTKESEVTSSHMHNIDQKVLGDNQDKKIFQLEELERATNNFSEENKLGRGGFGPVYKGILSDGQEIAVKRLSKTSTQGLQEFKNEVLVILKLQHRNLVRLLGCCIEGEEKMLIYEYLPNKSLDFFLFDSSKLTILDWGKRFQIIEGICRGVLYLHRDSRLRVIHRDLKASNVLLDEDLNPKISDFGMAKIFGGNELQANTLRIVGTYGYMSPEYAMEGRFSEKSDVFSFGVLLLEIVSGRRINSFYHMDESVSLLGYAWKLWKENKMLSFIDSTLSTGPNLEGEIIRCIQVGLLCVQDFVEDRPSMSTTLSMLTGEIATLPTPKRPAFNQIETSSESSLSQQTHRNYSLNNVTITDVKGR